MLENAEKVEDQTAEQPEENSIPEGKTFTQDEVNNIVKERLAREKSKFEELETKEKELAIKELRFEAKTVFVGKGFPDEAMELLDYTSKETLDTSIEKLEKAFGAYSKVQTPSKQFAPVNPSISTRAGMGTIDDAFAPPQYR